jgi:hypothetical protein
MANLQLPIARSRLYATLVMLRVIVPVAMILVFMGGSKARRIAWMRPVMKLVIGAHVTVRVSNSHITDVEWHANSGIDRDDTTECRSS